MKKIQSRFLISAPASGSGKTTLTLGLLRAVKNRGLVVQPFKCGPDYIDTKYHEAAAGLTSINLDTFMAAESHMIGLYEKYAKLADVCITEGVMGLYDGYEGMKGSSAEIARLTGVPVILVINAQAMAYSVAPMIYGFKNFRNDIHIVGVLFNFVSSEAHYSYLKQACEDVGVQSLGYLPKELDIEIPSRYLGLSLDKDVEFDQFADKIACLVEKHIDVDQLLKLTKIEASFADIPAHAPEEQAFTIAVANDEAFNFFYKENIERFREKGIVTYFSPLKDKQLPIADFVYLPGGYPELYLKELSENTEMLESIKQYAEDGGYLLAECGGMMYLSSAIIDEKEERFEMANVFEQDVTLQDMKLTLGYRQLDFEGRKLRGHEFHYSHLVEEDKSCLTKMTFTGATGRLVDTKMFRYRNTIAGYTHLYWAEYGLIEFFDMLLGEENKVEDYLEE